MTFGNLTVNWPWLEKATSLALSVSASLSLPQCLPCFQSHFYYFPLILNSAFNLLFCEADSLRPSTSLSLWNVPPSDTHTHTNWIVTACWDSVKKCSWLADVTLSFFLYQFLNISQTPCLNCQSRFSLSNHCSCVQRPCSVSRHR